MTLIDPLVRWLQFISQRTDANGRRDFWLHWLQSFPSDERRHQPVEIAGTLWWPRRQVFWANPVDYISRGYRVGHAPWEDLPRVPAVQSTEAWNNR